jgi:leucyl aminopeptidase (aminopeptidase T)
MSPAMLSAASNPATIARVLVGEALQLRRGEELVVASWNHTLPWATACVTEARRRGGRGSLFLEDETAFWRSVELAPTTRAWSGLPEGLRAAVRRADALVYFGGPADRPRFHRLPTTQLAPFREADEEWFRLSRAAGVRGVRCLLGYASDAQGEHWGVPGALWRNQLLKGMARAELMGIRSAGARVSRALARGGELHLTAANGTDVRMRLRRRTPLIDDGIVGPRDRPPHALIATQPAGLVAVAIDESRTHGTAIANRPSFLSGGRVEGGEWDIERGRLENYWYISGGESFDAEFGHAPKGREVVGLVAVGLNPALGPGVPQAEDAEAGTVTLAIGGNTLYGGTNRCRFLSWLTVGEASLAVDGAPVLDRGEIL